MRSRLGRGLLLVSIHAPARGATSYNPVNDSPIDVSIHAPARGATLLLDFSGWHKLVSIHAPARGATYTLRAICS